MAFRIWVVVGLLVVPGELCAQNPPLPQTHVFIDGWLEGLPVRDDWGEDVVLHSLTGWGADDNLRLRILGSMSAGGMAQFSDREGHYEEIIRAMVLQAGMGGLDRLELLARADSRGTMESLEVLLVAGELSATTVEILNSHGMLTRPLAEIASAAGAMGVPLPFAQAADVTAGLANVEHALSVFGAVAGAVSLGMDVQARVQGAILWRALEVDLAILRVESLARESTLDDEAFRQAAVRVEEDLRGIPPTLWQEMYRAALNDPSALVGTGLGAMGLGVKLSQLAGASGKVMPWIGAALFTGGQFQLAGEHRRDLRRMTAAATIHQSLRDAPPQGLSLENREALQLLFLEHRRAAFSNWTYNLVYRGVSRGWRQLLNEFEEDGRSYLALVTQRRVQILLQGRSPGPVLATFPYMLLDWAPGDTLARPIALLTPAGEWVDPWGHHGYCAELSPPIHAIPLGGRLEGLLLYRGGTPAPGPLSVEPVQDRRDELPDFGRLTRSATGGFRPTSQSSGSPERGRLMYLAPRNPVPVAAVPIPRDAALVLQSAEHMAARMIAQTGERLQPRVETALRLETPSGPRLLLELVSGLAPGVATTRDGEEARWVEDGWRLLTILSLPTDGSAGPWTQEYEHLSVPIEGSGPVSEAFLDLLDVTGDGWLEVVIQEAGWLWAGYKILQFDPPGGWRTFYTGGHYSSCS